MMFGIAILKWNTHIDNITSNGNKSLGYLKRNLQISNPEVKSRAYQAVPFKVRL
jgi:hypothetical protein